MPSSVQPNLGLRQGWSDGETGWGSEINADLRELDALVQGVVADKDLATPPSTPTAGDTYIVAASPTGAWATHAGHIARYSGAAWEFYTPRNGWSVWVTDEALRYERVAGVWTAREPGNVSSLSDTTVHNRFAQWNGTSGRNIYDGGIRYDTDTLLAANSDLRIASQKAIKTYIDSVVSGGATDVMAFKGVIDCSANPNYPAADRGNVYKISVAGKIGGASGVNVEVGDTAYCINAGVPAGSQAAVGANWVIVQVNVDGAVTGPTSSTDGNVALFNGATGKIIKDSGLALSGTNTGDETTTTLGSKINAATAKSTPVDADLVGLVDSAASFILKKLTWANLKATLKTYFDTLYGTGNGSVTSVALSAPAEFTVSGSPVTGSGTLTFTKATQTANKFYAGPTGGSAATPSFRVLAGDDLTSIVDNVTLATAGSPIMLAVKAGGVGTTELASDGVTYAKMQNVSAASKLLGRGDSGSGDVQELSLGSGLSVSGTTLSASITGSGAADEVTITITGSPAAFSLKDTVVTPGSYTKASITVDQQGRLTSASNGAAEPYDITVFIPSTQSSASQVLYRAKFARAVTFAADFTGSYFTATANATGSTVFDVQKNGSSIGSVTIGAGGTTATFVIAGSPSVGVSFAAGDIFALIGPASADATLANMGFTFVGTR